MKRLFCIGEINSSFYQPPSQECRLRTQALLESESTTDWEEGIKQFVYRHGFFCSLPENTKWCTAELPLSDREFKKLRTVCECDCSGGWCRYTERSHLLVHAAERLKKGEISDPRLEQVLASITSGNVETRGITLIAQSECGPYTIVEGHARLLALYLSRVDDRISPGTLAITLGLSQDKWRFSPN